MNRLFLVATAFALTLPVLGQPMSQVVLDSASGHTVEDLVALALAQNGGILAGKQQVAAARGGLTQARLKANPSIESSASKEILGSMNTFMIGGSLPLELYHRRERRMDVAREGIQMAEQDQADRERQLRAEVETKFGEVLAALRNLQVMEDLLVLNRQALELTQARADQGAAPPLNANLLRVEVNRIDALRLDLEAKLGVGILELKSLAGMNPDENLRLKGSLETAVLEANPESTVQQAIEKRPDLVSLRFAEQVAAARLRQAETDSRPDASVSVNYQRMDSSFDVFGLTATGQLRPVQGIFQFLGVGVSISLPVRNRNQGAIEIAVAEREEARRKREYAALIVRREVAAAVLAREKAQEGVRIYREGVRGQSSQNLEVVRQTYELGRTQLLDVIAEQRRFIDVEMGYTEALGRLYQASVRLRTVTGGQ